MAEAHGAGGGAVEYHEDPEDYEVVATDPDDVDEAHVLAHGTKAFAVSSQKPLTSKFRGEGPFRSSVLRDHPWIWPKKMAPRTTLFL